MKALVTFIILLVAAFCSVTGQATWPVSPVTAGGEEYVVAEEERARAENGRRLYAGAGLALGLIAAIMLY